MSAPECIALLHDAVASHLADVVSATGRIPEWSITTEAGSCGYAVCVVIIDGIGACDVSGRTMGEAHRAALVEFRRWRARQVIVRAPRELVANDAGDVR